MASALLVYARLIEKRHTLWGAIGAHMTFNTLATTNNNGVYNHVANPALLDPDLALGAKDYVTRTITIT